ncbi:hypothetical protein Esti_005671 [Eimeria stiedai]
MHSNGSLLRGWRVGDKLLGSALNEGKKARRGESLDPEIVRSIRSPPPPEGVEAFKDSNLVERTWCTDAAAENMSSSRGLRRAEAAAAALALLAVWGSAAGDDLNAPDHREAATGTVGELSTADAWGSLTDDMMPYDLESPHEASLEGEDDPSAGNDPSARDDPSKAYAVREARQQRKKPMSRAKRLRLTVTLFMGAVATLLRQFLRNYGIEPQLGGLILGDTGASRN